MDRCDSCRHVTTCPACRSSVTSFAHVGVRGTTSQLRIPILGSKITYDSQRSGVWHYAQPCQHRIYTRAPTTSADVKYNGGPLWKDGYTWQNIYWGSYYNMPTTTAWVQRLQRATRDIETDPT